MSTDRSEERALEVMRKELASEPVPDLPWADMERSLLARLDEPPMTSHPRSLDAHVDDVPVSSLRFVRMPFVRIGYVALAAAAAFALFWFSPLHSGKPLVISQASSSSPVPATPQVSADGLPPKVPAPQSPAPASTEAAPLTITPKIVRASFSSCIARDKRYGSAAKLKGEKLVVFLEPDGRISTIRFDSPIDRSVMECVFEDLRSGRFVGTTSPVTIQF